MPLHEFLVTSLHENLIDENDVLPVSRHFFICRTASLPISSNGTRTVVSVGADSRASGRSSKPTIARSSGTFIPFSFAALFSPILFYEHAQGTRYIDPEGKYS
jgi:hypothetical protein